MLHTLGKYVSSSYFIVILKRNS